MSERERSRSAQRKHEREQPQQPEQLTCKGVILDFDVQRHMELRRRSHPVFGLPMGTLPSNPQQNSRLGAPFAYIPEQLHQADVGLGSSRSQVFADLSARGYFVVCAVRHGFDFVIYESDPARHHGSSFVVIVEAAQKICPRQLVLWNRLAASAHKALLLALPSSQKGEESLRYFRLSGEER